MNKIESTKYQWTSFINRKKNVKFFPVKNCPSLRLLMVFFQCCPRSLDEIDISTLGATSARRWLSKVGERLKIGAVLRREKMTARKTNIVVRPKRHRWQLLSSVSSLDCSRGRRPWSPAPTEPKTNKQINIQNTQYFTCLYFYSYTIHSKNIFNNLCRDINVQYIVRA